MKNTKFIKRGTKLKRTGPSYSSSKIRKGNTYTYAGVNKNGWIKLKELASCGYGWDIDLFDIID